MLLAGKKNNPAAVQSLTDDPFLLYLDSKCTMFDKFPSQNFLARKTGKHYELQKDSLK